MARHEEYACHFAFFRNTRLWKVGTKIIGTTERITKFIKYHGEALENYIHLV